MPVRDPRNAKSDSRPNPPLRIRFSPQFVISLQDYLREFVNRPETSDVPNTGVLYGTSEAGLLIVQALRPEKWDEPQTDPCLEQSIQLLSQDPAPRDRKRDPEIEWLDLVGCFRVRGNEYGGLQAADVQHHRSTFGRNAGILLVIERSSSNVFGKVFANPPDSPLSPENYRHGTFSVEDGASVRESLKLELADRFDENLYLKAYRVVGALDRAERWEEWKQFARSVLKGKWTKF